MNKDFLIGCICIALSVTIFSTMEVFLKLPAVGAFDPMQLTLERAFVGGLLLIPVARYFLKKHHVKLTKRDYGYFAFSGFLTVVLFMALFQLAVPLAYSVSASGSFILWMTSSIASWRTRDTIVMTRFSSILSPPIRSRRQHPTVR